MATTEVDAAAIAASTDPAVNPSKDIYTWLKYELPICTHCPTVYVLDAATFFDKIVSKAIPASIVYEDSQCLGKQLPLS